MKIRQMQLTLALLLLSLMPLQTNAFSFDEIWTAIRGFLCALPFLDRFFSCDDPLVGVSGAEFALFPDTIDPRILRAILTSGDENNSGEGISKISYYGTKSSDDGSVDTIESAYIENDAGIVATKLDAQGRLLFLSDDETDFEMQIVWLSCETVNVTTTLNGTTYTTEIDMTPLSDQQRLGIGEGDNRRRLMHEEHDEQTMDTENQRALLRSSDPGPNQRQMAATVESKSVIWNLSRCGQPYNEAVVRLDYQVFAVDSDGDSVSDSDSVWGTPLGKGDYKFVVPVTARGTIDEILQAAKDACGPVVADIDVTCDDFIGGLQLGNVVGRVTFCVAIGAAIDLVVGGPTGEGLAIAIACEKVLKKAAKACSIIDPSIPGKDIDLVKEICNQISVEQPSEGIQWQLEPEIYWPFTSFLDSPPEVSGIIPSDFEVQIGSYSLLDPGDSDCPADQPTQSPVQQTTQSPAQQPVDSPTGSPTASPAGQTLVAGAWGDPHFTTFSGLKYDCQATAEVVLLVSLDSDFQMQGRQVPFTFPGGPTVTSGIVVREVDLPTIQVSVATLPGSPATIGACPVELYVDGVLRSLTSGSGSSLAQVSISAGRISLFYPSTELALAISVNGYGAFCYFSYILELPFEYRSSERINGLLGTPTGYEHDDWTTPDGSAIGVPSELPDRYFAPAYEYCTTHWCLRNSTRTLFAYEQGKSFSSFSFCDAAYDPSTEIAIANPPSDLAALCGSDLGCLIDGITVDPQAAQQYLDDEEALKQVREFGFGSCQRILASYFVVVGNINSMPDFDTLSPYLKEFVSVINSPFNQPLAGSGRATYVSAYFEAGLQFPSNGTWTLCLSSDNGSRLFINGQEVVAVLGLGRVCSEYSVAMDELSRDVRVEFWQTYGSIYLQFLWSGPTVPSEEVVPACAFQALSCTPSPQKTCYFSCADALASDCSRQSGQFEICPNGIDSRKVFCDQYADGGGWMLLYSYKHDAGDNSELVPGVIPLNPNIGYSHFFVNEIPGYRLDDVESVRFYCRTSGHDRVIHFVTSHPFVASVAFTGNQTGNNPDYWKDSSFMYKWGDHGAFIPDATDSLLFSNTFLPGGFDQFPFYNGYNYHWAIRGLYQGNYRFECDDIYSDYGGLSYAATSTLHNVWVRMKAAPSSP